MKEKMSQAMADQKSEAERQIRELNEKQQQELKN